MLVVKNIVEVVKKVVKGSKFISMNPADTLFKLHNNTLHYHTWAQKGITHLHHLFHNNQFIDYKDLIQTYGIERHEFLKYPQLKSIIKSKMNTTHNPLESPKITDDIIKLTDLKKLTSKLYKLILTIDKSIIVAITHWNKDLNISPSTDFWTEINQNIFTMTSNTNLQLIQYKIIHRTHITQYKMYKMGLANTDTCSQCTSGTSDNYFHALWACQPVHSFWGSVTQKLSTILNYRIPSSPQLCLLGDISVINIPNRYKNSLLISLTVAKKTILLNWKSKNSININHWTNLLSECISMEKITAHNKNNITVFMERWSPFLSLMGLGWWQVHSCIPTHQKLIT